MSNHYAEPKYNAAFDRCIDVMVNMMLRYGPSLIDPSSQGIPLLMKAIANGKPFGSMPQAKKLPHKKVDLRVAYSCKV